jgi:hypothetical protein
MSWKIPVTSEHITKEKRRGRETGRRRKRRTPKNIHRERSSRSFCRPQQCP